MGTEVKRLNFDCGREKKAMAHTVGTVGPFHWEEEGVEGFVDLGSTKRALSLSREPNPSIEKQELMGNSLSSTAIQPPRWKPQIKSSRESKAIMWGATFEILGFVPRVKQNESERWSQTQVTDILLQTCTESC